ncbi:hypothetical protein Q1695_003523 [Nippostrongylus brasiliensis]|nr:hypothetical protein Q1695_003523 [Nippostrongylus brasiliensis]
MTKNSWFDGGHIELDEYPLAEMKLHVHLGSSMNMDNDMKEELIRRRRAGQRAGLSKKATDQLHNANHRANLFDSDVLLALRYAAEMCPHAPTTVSSLQVKHGALSVCEVHGAIPRWTTSFHSKADASSCGIHVESQTSMGRSHSEKRRRPLDKKRGMAAVRLHVA